MATDGIANDVLMTTLRRHLVTRLGSFGPATHACYLPWLVIGWLWLISFDTQAGPLVTPESPIGFFTNVAARLLQSQLGVNLNHIQVYPTNQYTPSVHRLLQVAANLYDAATNRPTTDYPYPPTVFRPVFASHSGGSADEIYICTYTEVTAADTPNLAFNWQNVRDLTDPYDRATFQPLTDMVYGIPLIIGAKKGFPSFNKLAMQTQVQVTRKLQFHRPGTSTTQPVNEIDQMFVVGISNSLGVEAWNSYAAAFPRELQLVVWPDISVLLTNLDTGKWLNAPPLWSRYRLAIPVTTNLAANAWAGYDTSESPPSADFQIPLFTNLIFLTNMVYRQQGDTLVDFTSTFERIGGTNFYSMPHLELTFRPRLRFALVDKGTQRIVDYVNLADRNGLDVPDALDTGGQCGDPYTPDSGNGSMWCTNRLHGANPSDISVATYGINNQIDASMGRITADWNSSTHEFPTGMDKVAAINFFKGQFIPNGQPTSNTFNAPFQPFRNIYLLTSWQANDPLVHYMLSDLTDLVHSNLVVGSFSSTTPRPTDRLGMINARYEPWGGGVDSARSGTALDLKVKDPLLLRSDSWDFPTNSLPDLNWLGRVHRGTPWQTLYLKAPGVSLATWKQWTGNNQLVTNSNGQVWADAAFTQPTNDWHLASLVISLLNPNNPHNLASVNQPGVPAWCGLLHGMTVLTNHIDSFGYEALAPLIMYSNSPQAALVATALDAARFGQPSQHFRNLGDILATPELSTTSPWLDLSIIFQSQWEITDAAYEAIPA